jgi:toxin ParE1/3/4
MVYRLAPRARDDLDAIWDYIAHEARAEAPADKLIDAITQRLWLLSEHPRIGRVRNDLGLGLRSFPVSSYVIVYEVSVIVYEVSVIVYEVSVIVYEVSGRVVS